MKLYKDYMDLNWKEYIVKLDTGINMAYYEAGHIEGIPIMLIHGVTDSCIAWAQIVPGLVECGYHCYIVEYRGNGMTDKPDMGEDGYTTDIITDDIINLMDKIGLEKAHFVGHSYGSLISQVIAAKFPEKCLSCILINTGVDCKAPAIDYVKQGDGNYLGLDAYEDFLPEDFCKDWMTTTNEDESFRTALVGHAKQMPVVAWKNLMNGLEEFDSSGFLHKIIGNVLVIWSTEDEIFTKENQDRLKRGLVSCKVKYIDVEGASHNGFWDSIAMAEKYVDYIDQFIKSN